MAFAEASQSEMALVLRIRSPTLASTTQADWLNVRNLARVDFWGQEFRSKIRPLGATDDLARLFRPEPAPTASVCGGFQAKSTPELLPRQANPSRSQPCNGARSTGYRVEVDATHSKPLAWSEETLSLSQSSTFDDPPPFLCSSLISVLPSIRSSTDGPNAMTLDCPQEVSHLRGARLLVRYKTTTLPLEPGVSNGEIRTTRPVSKSTISS